MEAPFVPSLWVEIRKRMGAGVFEVFHGAIIAALGKAKRKPAPGRRPKPGKGEVQQPESKRDVLARMRAQRREDYRQRISIEGTMVRAGTAIVSTAFGRSVPTPRRPGSTASFW